jgi:sulfotransferase family protein
MKVIGAGLPRTGTLSQKVALEMLGVGPCYHMVNVLLDLDQVGPWRRALEGDRQWDEIFDGFQSTVDWPGSYFYRELVDYYPDAKVLLSTRDGDAWARSMRETIYATLYGDVLIGHLSQARCEIDPKWCGYIDLMKDMWDRSGLLQGAATTDEWMSEAVDRFHEQVKANVPADRLLVWSPAEGWEPLCEFLELPAPDTPFPHLNDTEQFVERIVDGALLAIQAWRAESDEVSTPVS